MPLTVSHYANPAADRGTNLFGPRRRRRFRKGCRTTGRAVAPSVLRESQRNKEKEREGGRGGREEARESHRQKERSLLSGNGGGRGDKSQGCCGNVLTGKEKITCSHCSNSAPFAGSRNTLLPPSDRCHL